MNIDRKVIEQALEALEQSYSDLLYDYAGRHHAYAFEADIAALREAQPQPVQQEPVAAQQRFRHPQKTMPDWSPWQPCKVADRPAWQIDSQGYEVEYRALYTPPQAAQPQPVQQDHYKELAALGWQAIECPVCGSSAQGYPRQAAQPLREEPSPISVLLAVEESIKNGECPWQIEQAFDEYEAQRQSAITKGTT